MNARDLRAKYCLEVNDLPNQSGLNVVTIAGIQVENYTGNENGRQVPKQRKNLWFREFQLPLRLNNTRIDVLISLLGDETDAWTGRRIGLFVGAVTSFGETKTAILIHLQPQDDGRPQLPTGVPAGAGGGAQAGNAPAAAAPPAAFDVRPIGTGNADKFKGALAEQAAKYDEFLAWLRRVDATAYDRAHGVAIEDLPRGLAPLMQRFLKEYPSTKAGPLPAPMPPDDDIPF